MEDLSDLVSRELLKRAVARAVGAEDVQLCGRIHVERATGAVEGFTSLILRVTVPYRRGDLRRRLVLVVKRMPLAEPQLDLAVRCRVFDREGAFFGKVMPLMKAASEGKVQLPLPECFLVATCGGDEDAIFMEDLLEWGYRTPEARCRTDGLDLAHCTLAVNRLGRLHAVALAAERALPVESAGWADIPEFARDSLFYDPDPEEPPMPLLGMINQGLETVVMISRELDGLPKEAEASGALAKVIGGVWSSMCRMVRSDPNGRNVLTHGDCWMNNMMFRYGEDGSRDPLDVKFIDLQIVRYCNPSIDLLYFMYLCTTKSFRECHFERLVLEYYESLSETLRILGAGSAPFSLAELTEDLRSEYRPFGVIIGALFTPILRLGEDFVPSTAAEMTTEKYKEFFETGNSSVIRSRFASDPKYRIIMEGCVREFVDMALPEGDLRSSPMLK